MGAPTEPADEPKPAEPQPTDGPPPSANPPALDLTDEEWIAAGQSCCGRQE